MILRIVLTTRSSNVTVNVSLSLGVSVPPFDTLVERKPGGLVLATTGCSGIRGWLAVFGLNEVDLPGELFAGFAGGEAGLAAVGLFGTMPLFAAEPEPGLAGTDCRALPPEFPE